MLYALGANWMIGFYFAEGMELLPDIKGTTASILTSARLLITALIVGVASALYDATIYPITAVVVGTVVAVLPLMLFYEKRRSHSPLIKSVESQQSHF
jgi:DHA1 family bicyclomycin/chloramphenicol resistance-like MFS transporter